MTWLKTLLAPLCLSLAIGGISLAPSTVHAQEYDQGINWFDDNEGYGENEGLFDVGLGEEEYEYESDDYGYYNSDYNWTTDDSEYDGWYGESDGLFDWDW